MFRRCKSLSIALSALGLHLAGLLWLEGADAALASNLAQLAAALLALSACFQAARRTVSRVRRFWLLASLSFTIWAFAQVLWIWQENVLGHAMPLLALPHVLFFFAFIPMGIALLDDDAQGTGLDWLVVLDTLQIALTAGTTYFYLFHVPGLWPNREALAQTFANAIHFRNAVLVLTFFVRGILATRSERWLYLRWTAFLMVYALANIGGSFAIIWLGLPSGTGFDLAWSAPFLLAALIADGWRDESGATEPVAATGNLGRLLGLNLLPLTIPVLILWMGSRIAMADLTMAAIAISLAVACYALRSLLLQMRQQRSAGKLHLSETRFRLFFAAHPQPMWVFDARTLEFLEVNDAAVSKYGYSRAEFLRMHISAIRAPEDGAELEGVLRQEQEKFPMLHARHRLKSGESIAVEIAARRLDFTGNQAMLVVAIDVSERMALEEQLRQAQKMEAVGALAGGVAHDFNNLLTVIKGYSSLLSESLADDLVRKREVEQIEHAADRAAALTRQLLAFSRRQIFRLTPVNLNQTVQAVSRMLERLLGEDILVVQELAPDLGKIQADPSQIDQVIMNLAVNARDAMPRGGKLTFATRNVSATEFGDEEHLHITPGPYVLLRVTDTGVGMEPATRRRIFEPFFTTKESKGTGLGLSTVYGIVKQSGGHIWVESEVGIGTTFSLLLPRINKSGDDPVSMPTARTSEPVEGQTILLVEDESSLRQFAEHVLARAGFKVLTAKSGEHALEVFTKHTARIHLLLTDLVMPGINGHDLAELLRQRQPSLSVVYMTGYTQEAIVLKGVNDLSLNLIEKPFTKTALIKKIGEVLGFPASGLAPLQPE
jgi:two-component system, cell cycle sensor histidine kinase and response regulator CckA